MPILSYSSTTDADVAERSAELGFACHLSTPLSVVAIAHQVALAAPVDLAARLRRAQPTLRRHLSRVEIARDMYRSVNASLEPLECRGCIGGARRRMVARGQLGCHPYQRRR